MKNLNIYSKVILHISIVLMLIGLVTIVISGVIIQGKHYFASPLLFLLGFAFLSLGVLIIVKGLRTVTPSPQKVWLITWFGNKTNTIVNSWPVLLLDWPIDIVGHVEFEVQTIDKDFKLKKEIICNDGAYIIGEVSAGLVPNASNSEALRNYDDIGRMEEVVKQLDDMITASVQRVANLRDSLWMEMNSSLLTLVLLKLIIGSHGMKEAGGPANVDLEDLLTDTENESKKAGFSYDLHNHSLDDARGFGIIITKFVPNFKAPDKVREARDERNVEIAQRKAELQETETVHQQIEARYELYNGRKTKEECREEIIAERLMKEGRFNKIENQGGVNLANVDTNQGGSK